MDLVFDISSSMGFWRRVYPADRAPSNPLASISRECIYACDEVRDLLPPWVTSDFLLSLGGKIHLLAFKQEQRRRSSTCEVHTWSGDVPPNSFYRLSERVLIAAPEFIFLAAAAILGRHELIALGFELCGYYGFDERTDRGFRKREVPLTTIERLRRYLAGARNCRGYRNAVTAIPFVISGSASPMETFDAMAICLPYRLGGYSLSRLVMNYEVPLSGRAKRIAKRDKCYADMCYPSIKLDIEHHGKHDHTSDKDRASDRARVNALKEDGYEVIELTAGQVGDLLTFEYLVLRVAKKLGKRMQTSKLGATPERLKFRASVFAWNKSGGRLR